MAEKQKQPSQKLGKGLPVAPWIFINNSFDCSTIYSDALCSLIPHSQVYKRFELLTGFGGPKSRPVSIWADSSAEANEAAEMARSCQVEALNHGCNMASISLCNDNTFSVFSALEGRNWPQNHLSINVDRVPVEEVAKRIVRWLFTVLSVRETLYLIPESEMRAIDTKNYPDYKYCAINDARNHTKNAKIQFVALVSSKPELTEPNKLTWRVVDRSGEAKFYFHHRGPTSQHTWDWVLSLKPGDRKVLPRMPMVPLHEPAAKKVLLSPLRVTGATIRGVGHITMGLGKGVHWLGDKVSIRRTEEQRFMPEADWLDREAALDKKKEEKKQMKKDKREVKAIVGTCGTTRYGANSSTEKVEEVRTRADFKIFNEKGEKTWKDLEDDTASTVAASLVDEKLEKEFC